MPQVEKNSELKLIPVQHHFLIISFSYALNQIWYSPNRYRIYPSIYRI